MKCGIIIVDTGPLKTLAYADSLELLLIPGIPVHISDMVICELRNGQEYPGNAKAIAFIDRHMNQGLGEIETGVPEIADKLRELRVDPGDESVRRIIKQYEEDTDGEYALLVSEDDHLMRAADPEGHTFLMTTRPFLKELENRGLIEDAEALMQKAEDAAIEANETPGRGQLNRRREFNIPPTRNILVKPF